jgi:hypothetical protein
MAGSPRIEELQADARYHRDRYALYRAKMYGSRPTTLTRLRELERAHRGADARLRRAKDAESRDSAGQADEPVQRVAVKSVP